MSEGTTTTYKISEMTVEQLEMVSQGLGHQIDKLRQDRAQIAGLIKKKLAEREAEELQAQIDELVARKNAVAPGAVIEAAAST